MATPTVTQNDIYPFINELSVFIKTCITNQAADFVTALEWALVGAELYASLGGIRSASWLEGEDTPLTEAEIKDLRSFLKLRLEGLLRFCQGAHRLAALLEHSDADSIQVHSKELSRTH